MFKPLAEQFISTIAPFPCLICETEGQVICENCLPTLGRPVRGVCYMCNGLSQDFRTCATCNRKTALKRTWVACRYEAYVKQLIWEYKFERKRSAYLPLARLIEKTVLAKDYDLIVPVPVASSRFRRRGYNQAHLLASYLVKSWKIPIFDGLYRLDQKRQVGHSRADRKKQLLDSFYVKKAEKLQSKKLLLVDDVITTGSTLDACASVLAQNGTKRIEAAVIAKA